MIETAYDHVEVTMQVTERAVQSFDGEGLATILGPWLRYHVGEVFISFTLEHLRNLSVVPSGVCCRCNAALLPLPPLEVDVVLELLERRRIPHGLIGERHVDGLAIARSAGHNALVAHVGDLLVGGIADVACSCVRDHLALRRGPRPTPCRARSLALELARARIERAVDNVICALEQAPAPAPTARAPIVVVGETFDDTPVGDD